MLVDQNVEAVKIVEADMDRAKPLCSPFLKLWYKGTRKKSKEDVKFMAHAID